jgi:hypothetical protein
VKLCWGTGSFGFRGVARPSPAVRPSRPGNRIRNKKTNKLQTIVNLHPHQMLSDNLVLKLVMAGLSIFRESLSVDHKIEKVDRENLRGNFHISEQR